VKPECVVDAHNLCGECPLWHPEENCIYWTDINGFTIRRYSLKNGDVKVWNFGDVVCALSLTSDPNWMLVALGSRVLLWSPENDQKIELCQPEPAWPRIRLNDGASDANGFFWIGTMRNDVGADGSHLEVSGNEGSLYRIAADGTVTVWDTGFGITNTVVWSPDRTTFYCGCSIGNIIHAYDFDAATSSISAKRTFVSDLNPGIPDGSAMDSQGYLWNCRYFGGCILRISPAGAIDHVIEMPVSNITHCCFAGADLKTLFITTASLQSPAEEKYAGGLFAIPVDVSGLPINKFRVDDRTVRGGLSPSR
jgi:sugar lactone lactonase YvrE